MPDQTARNADSDHWFGYRRVDAAEKSSLVRGVFSSVASRYDLMNDLMSGGIHRLWKARLIEMIPPRPGQPLLDLAGGTGDVAFRYLDRARRSGIDASAVLCDLSEEMIAVGRDRAIDRGVIRNLGFAVGNAEALPFPDRSVPLCTIAFGLRNVTHIDQALAEARRVLKPGGRFFCLEFSHVVLAPLRRLYQRYSDAVIPRLGQVVAGDRDSYDYLVESIRRFPTQPALADRMRAAGLGRVRWLNLSGGIAAIHSGWRL